MASLTHVKELLAQAAAEIAELNGENTGCCGGSCNCNCGQPADPPPTQSADPRAPNARDHATDKNGKVTGVFINVHRTPGARFVCQSVRLIDENEAQGNTIIRVKFTGASGPLFLATGYQGNATSFDDFLPDSSGHGELVMAGSGAKFYPPNLGPLAVVVRENGQIISDVIGNLGLSRGAHVSYEVVFSEA